MKTLLSTIVILFMLQQHINAQTVCPVPAPSLELESDFCYDGTGVPFNVTSCSDFVVVENGGNDIIYVISVYFDPASPTPFQAPPGTTMIDVFDDMDNFILYDGNFYDCDVFLNPDVFPTTLTMSQGVFGEPIVDFTNLSITCAPEVVSIFIIQFDRFNFVQTTCDVIEIPVTLYPQPLTTNIVDDGSTCGTPEVQLVASDGSVCETLTGPACTDGGTFTTDFANTTTGALFANAPAACALPDDITISCDGCDACGATASTISTTDPTTICVDGVGDPIDVNFEVAGMGPGAWVITDAAGIILGLPPGPPFDLDGAGAGQCLIWYVNVDDATFAPAVGDDAAAIVAASSCAFLSNPITVDRIEVTAPVISTTDPLTICADDGIADPITVTIDDAGTGGTATAWVITDAAGIILALPPGPTFDLEGAGGGTCLIWLVSTNDASFAPAVGDDAVAAVAAATCATLSNSIAVSRQTDCAACGASASVISTTDPTRICVDGVGDPINVDFDVAGMGPGAWVITDAAGIILGLPPGPPFDLDGAGAGQCLIWYVNVDDPSFAPAVGDDAAAIVAASDCAFLSNPITVDRIEVTGATISTTDNLTICTDDGIDEPIDVTIDDAGIGANGAWVITDAAGTILALPPGPPFTLDGAGVGTCLIWWVNYEDPTFAPAVGDDAGAIVAASSCAALSNSIAVDRIACDEDCDANIGTFKSGN